MISIPNLWYWFAAALALQLVFGLLKARQQRKFRYLRGAAITKFSIMDLELPASPASICNIMSGIDNLPPADAAQTRRALRMNLLLDFVYMAGAYPAIFLLCTYCAGHMESGGIGYWIFKGLAFLLIPAWIADLVENFFLLRQLRRPAVTKLWFYNAYRFMVQFKWAVIGIAGICAVSDQVYNWLVGRYEPGLVYLGFALLGLIGLACIFMIYRTVRAMLPTEKPVGAQV